MQKPPPFVLTEAVHTTATAPPGMRIHPSTGTTIPNSGRFGPPRNTRRYQQVLQHFTGPLEAEYQGKTTHIPLTIEADLAAARQEISTQPLPPAASLIRELGVRNTVIQRKTQQLQHQTHLSHGFYGSDPTDKTVSQFLSRAQIVDPILSPNGPGMNLWKQSYRAALEARLLAQTLTVLHQQQANVHNWLTTVQANEQAQAAAAEAARQAAERARIAAEQQRQQALADAARRQREQEQRDREREKNALESKAREEAQAKRRAEYEARFKAMRDWLASLDEAKKQRPYAVSVSTVATTPVFTVASGQLATRTATAAAVRAALQNGVATVTTLAAASASAVLVGFAALLFPSPLADGEGQTIPDPLSEFKPDNVTGWMMEFTSFKPEQSRALSVPLSALLPALQDDLYAIAQAGGDIDLPVTLGSKTTQNATEFFVAATNGTTIPSKAPVRLSTFDSGINAYRVYSPDAPSIGMTWIPIVTPGNASTTRPPAGRKIIVYDGTTVAALEGRIDTHPELDAYSFGGFITVFPVESGIPPIFTMFRDRRQDPGVATGNGQVVSGNWLGAASTPQGAPIPAQVADKLRGREFSNFRTFRETFWKLVANDPELKNQFIETNVEEMKGGRAPFVRKIDRQGGQVKFELHHMEHISKGGEVYGIDNIRIATPRQHSEIHRGEN